MTWSVPRRWRPRDRGACLEPSFSWASRGSSLGGRGTGWRGPGSSLRRRCGAGGSPIIHGVANVPLAISPHEKLIAHAPSRDRILEPVTLKPCHGLMVIHPPHQPMATMVIGPLGYGESY